MRLFEKGMLRKIFGHKRDEVTGEWRKVHNEELLKWSPNIVRVIEIEKNELGGHVARMGRGEVCTGFLVGKETPGSSRRRWEDNIKVDIQKVRSQDMD
jgi:hypothetical protein